MAYSIATVWKLPGGRKRSTTGSLRWANTSTEVQGSTRPLVLGWKHGLRTLSPTLTDDAHPSNRGSVRLNRLVPGWMLFGCHDELSFAKEIRHVASVGLIHARADFFKEERDRERYQITAIRSLLTTSS